MQASTNEAAGEMNDTGRALMAALRSQISAYDAAAAASHDSKEALTAAKPALHSALHSLLRHVATNEVPEPTRAGVDDELCANAQTLKWGLLRGLQRPDLARSYLGLSRTAEQTRIFLAGISAKKAADILEAELGANIDRCDDPDELRCVREVVAHMTGAGRFKKDLGGVDLAKDTKRTCRTAINRAEKAEKELRAARAKENRPRTRRKSAAVSRNTVSMERDVREEDREREAARAAAFDRYLDGVMGGDANR